MRSIATAVVGICLFVIASILAILEWIHLRELIETHLPEWMIPVISLKSIFIMMFIGLLMMGMAYLELRGEKRRGQNEPKQEPQEGHGETPNTSVRISGVRQEANPTIDASQKVEIHNHPLPQRIAKPLPLLTPPNPQPNVQFLGASRSQFGQVDGLFTDDQTIGRPLIGIKAGFRNQYVPDKRIAVFPFARAHVIFRDQDGREVCDVPSCTWLGERTSGVDLELGQSHWFVLAFYANGTWGAMWTKRAYSEHDWMGGTSYEYDYKSLPYGLITAEITLISDPGTSIAPSFVSMQLDPDGGCNVVEQKASK